MMHLELNVKNQVSITLDNLIDHIREKQEQATSQAEEFIWQQFAQDVAKYKHAAIVKAHEMKFIKIKP